MLKIKKLDFFKLIIFTNFLGSLKFFDFNNFLTNLLLLLLLLTLLYLIITLAIQIYEFIDKNVLYIKISNLVILLKF